MTTELPSPTSPPVAALSCGQLLLSNLDALEVALGDPAALEEGVQALLDAAGALRGSFTSLATKPAPHSLPQPGQVVWSRHVNAQRTPEAGTVQCTFVGRDGRHWAVLEHADEEDSVRYSCRPVLGLSSSAEGPNYLREALNQPAFARDFLQRIGIIDEQGRLTPSYGGPLNADS